MLLAIKKCLGGKTKVVKLMKGNLSQILYKNIF